jgi:hypothetical protein
VTTAAQKKLMEKNLKAANINGDIIGCVVCIPMGRASRYIVPDFQPCLASQCSWCGRKITKHTIKSGKDFKKIGRIEKGVTRFYNSKKKLVALDKLNNTEKASIGLTPSGNQKKSSKTRY